MQYYPPKTATAFSEATSPNSETVSLVAKDVRSATKMNAKSVSMTQSQSMANAKCDFNINKTLSLFMH